MYYHSTMKRKRRDRTILNKEGSPYSLSSKLKQEELGILEKAKELLLPIKKKYNLTFDDLKRLLEEKLFFPVEIFNKKLTVLESVVKYLKEEKNLSLHNISDIIGRDQRNVWCIYNKTKKKNSEKFIIKKVEFWIPISIFFNTKLSALESIVKYLKEIQNLKYHEIAVLLKRNDRTIWTVYQRSLKKSSKKLKEDYAK